MVTESTSWLDKTRFGVGVSSLVGLSTVTWLAVWALLVPLALGWSPTAVLSGSMGPAIDTGDIVVAEPHDGDGLGPGAVIVFDDPASEGRVTHRIVDVTPSGDYVTRGDANGRIDSTPVPPESVEGVGRILVPFVGKPYVWVTEGQWRSLVVAGLVLALALWTSRWGLQHRFDPWRAAPIATAVSDRNRSAGVAVTARPTAFTLSVAVVAFLMLASAITGVGTDAAYAGTTAGTGNSWTGDVLAPATGVNASSGASITIDWTATVDTYATGHRVLRSTTPGGPYSQIAAVTPRTTTTYVDSPAPGTYYYVVRAYYLGWESIDSNEASATAGPVEDYDAVPPGADNCPSTFNIDQFDTDGDGIGDACDLSPTLPTAGTLTDSGQTLGSLASFDVAVGDVDGDGDLDLAFANNDDPNTVWLNDGTGTFTDSGQSLDPTRSEGVVMADLDGDGDLDLAFANNDDPNTVWLNDGTGTFTDTGQSLDPNRTEGMALGDFDGDGDLDIVYANDADGNKVYLNDGAATFTDSGQTLSTARSANVAVGDLDGDGDLDITFANNGTLGTVWVNDGTGTFTDSGQGLDKNATVAIAVGDFERDGDLDVVNANDGKDNSVYVNDGAGIFTTSGQALGKLANSDVAVGDLDGDGDLDITFALNGSAGTVYLNDGAGTFTDSGQALDPGATEGVALGDLDGDGDLDVVNANNGSPNTVWLNS